MLSQKLHTHAFMCMSMNAKTPQQWAIEMRISTNFWKTWERMRTCLSHTTMKKIVLRRKVCQLHVHTEERNQESENGWESLLLTVKKLTVNFIWDNFYLFFKWRANNFLSWDFSAGKALQLLLINEQILIFLFIIQTIIDKCVAITSRLLLETSTASIFYFCSISKAHFVYFSQVVGSSAVKI